MVKREVLVLDSTGNVGDQLNNIPDDSLVFIRRRTVGEARQSFHQNTFGVALVVFDADYQLQRTAVEQLVSGPPTTEWIALVEPPALADHDFQAFILRVFHDYHTLPIDGTRLAMTIGHAFGRSLLRAQVDRGRITGHGRYEICGASPVMSAFFQRLERVIESDVPVLIGGETGTGKELVAQAIHHHSTRAGGPMVVVNCGAIPANLIQSELFGYEKSAFTGATQRHIGKIEAAKGGVLFLDEIGDLPLSMQASFLRVLQEHTISRVGSTQVIPVDCRIIAATHVDLREAVNQGRFREDLFFRLNVISLTVPPLRERGDDIILLAEILFRKNCGLSKSSRVKGFSQDTLRAMSAYSWPGNVRELINRVQRAIIMSENRLITPSDLGLDTIVGHHTCPTLDDARASFDRDLLETSLKANGNKVSLAARQLGVSRVTLYRMINKLNIPLNT